VVGIRAAFLRFSYGKWLAAALLLAWLTSIVVAPIAASEPPSWLFTVGNFAKYEVKYGNLVSVGSFYWKIVKVETLENGSKYVEFYEKGTLLERSESRYTKYWVDSRRSLTAEEGVYFYAVEWINVPLSAGDTVTIGVVEFKVNRVVSRLDVTGRAAYELVPVNIPKDVPEDFKAVTGKVYYDKEKGLLVKAVLNHPDYGTGTLRLVASSVIAVPKSIEPLVIAVAAASIVAIAAVRKPRWR